MTQWMIWLTFFQSALAMVGAGILFVATKAIQKGAETAGERIAAALATSAEWQATLARELQKTRGVERQELRFKSYGALWKALRPLALYGGDIVDQTRAAALSDALTDWYFSADGGLMLTAGAREFYFALQDVLRTAGSTPKWTLERTDKQQRPLFKRVLEDKSHSALTVLEYFDAADFTRWPQLSADHGRAWRKSMQDLAASWAELQPSERFAVLQQVGSVLRTALTNDVESRLP